jgi:hypothetical protein
MPANTDENGRYQYPGTPWSQGKMRKQGEPPDPLEGSEWEAGMQKWTIGEHKRKIADGLNEVETGERTSRGFQSLLKRLGWSQDKNGLFIDRPRDISKANGVVRAMPIPDVAFLNSGRQRRTEQPEWGFQPGAERAKPKLA